MAALVSKLNPRSEDSKANAAAMRALVEDLNAKLAKIAEGGGEAARAKHLGRGRRACPTQNAHVPPPTPCLKSPPCRIPHFST